MARTPNVRRHVQSVRAALRRIDRSLAVLAALAQRSGRGPAQAAGKRRKLKLSPARRRALKLQGRYLGYMRQLAPAQKSRVRAAKQARGMRAAIALAKKLAAA
jgi:hypothetical protein